MAAKIGDNKQNGETNRLSFYAIIIGWNMINNSEMSLQVSPQLKSGQMTQGTTGKEEKLASQKNHSKNNYWDSENAFNFSFSSLVKLLIPFL